MTGSNAGATIEAGEPAEISSKAGGSVWWSWTAPTTGRFLATTAKSKVDTVLAIFTGDTLGALSLVGANDDEDLVRGVFTSRVRFAAQAGVTYHFAVAGVRSGETGFSSGDLRLEIVPAAAKPAPGWEAVTVDGKPIRSADLQGKVVVLDFWATWCAPCRAEIPIFIDLQNQFGTEGLAIVGISVDTAGVNAVKQFMAELDMTYPVFMTQAQLEKDLGGVPSVPTAYVIARDGSVVERHVGFGDRDFWESTLLPLLKESGSSRKLNLELVEGQLQLSWPKALADLRLEKSGSLSALDWVEVTAPVVEAGDQRIVRQPVGGRSGFFRLRSP